MLYLYIDESGDLGFDFPNKKPSEYFTITVLTINGIDNNNKLIRAVKKTIARKLYEKATPELKGSHTSIMVKRYFYNLISSISFNLYALTLNKRPVHNHLDDKKERVYNFIAHKVLDQVPLDGATTKIQIIIDKSKSGREIKEFNDYIVQMLKGRIEPCIPLNIDHYTSHQILGIQAVDMFSYGIFRKYEKKDYEWFNIFKEKVKYDNIYYLP